MRKPAICVAILVTAAALSGCGKSKLTDEQKAVVADTMRSMGRAGAAAQDAKAGGAPAAPAPAPAIALNALPASTVRWLGNVAAASTIGGASEDEVSVSMGQKLKDARCNVDLAGDVSSYSNPTLHVSVSGPSCPASLTMGITVEGDGSDGHVKADFTCKYQVTDPSFANLNDVDSMDIGGGYDMTSSSDHKSFSLSLDISGKVHSQKKGDVKIAAKGKMSFDTSSAGKGGGDYDFVLELTYPDFTADLEVKAASGGIKYYINDEEVTREQFSAYFDKLGVGSSGSSAMPGA